jgi:hypothetical protein
LLRSRFEGTSQYTADGDRLVDYYRAMIGARLADENRALFSSTYAFLRARDTGRADPRIFAMVKWSGDGNVMFVFHNLWEQTVSQSYFIPEDLGRTLNIQDGREYRLVDVLSGQDQGECRSGADLKWDLYVALGSQTRFQWLRLELCP